MAAIVCGAIVLGALHIAGAARVDSSLQDYSADGVARFGSLASSAELVGSSKIHNDPDKYWYVKEMSEAIVHNDMNGRYVHDYDKNDRPWRSGHILANIVGTCPNSFLCGDQAVTVSAFGNPTEVVTYWSKPHEVQECTRSRHVASNECKNDSDKFEAMENLFNSGNGKYTVDHVRKRAVMTHNGQRLYVYLIYVADWSTWSRELRGWLLYQRDPDSQEFFRIRFDANSKLEFRFHGSGHPMDSFWPRRGEVEV